MKKIMLLLSVLALSLNMFSGDDINCDLVFTSYTNSNSPIEVWEENYQPCLYYEWNMTFPVEWKYIDLDYTVDLNPCGALDDLWLYVTDENGQEHEVLHYLYQPIAGRITLPVYTHTARLVFKSYYGNMNGLYKGFKLYYQEGHANTNNHVFFSNVGIGTYPKEALHVNGAIRGGGANGQVTLKGDSGYVTIGASGQAMEFITDKEQYVFDKPIYNQSGTYNVQNSNLSFNINDTNCVTILQNSGNVGIGTQNPNYKLDVNGTIRANEIIVNTTGADFVFAEDYKLRPLSEVKAFIQENKHLPEIKSAQEMQENGVGINELQTQLLQKIEELTLYILQQNEKILQQEIRIKALEEK